MPRSAALRSGRKVSKILRGTTRSQGVTMAVEASATISFMRPEPIPPREDEAAFRPQPNSVEETGIGFGQILDLCTKTIYYGGRPSAREKSGEKTRPLHTAENPPP